MLEIFLMVKLVKRIGAMLRDRGRRPGFYQVLAVFLWVLGEITGAVAGVVFELGNAGYLLALGGAAFGAALGYLIASSVKPAMSLGYQVGPVFD